MAVVLRWANAANIVVSVILLILGLAILGLGAAASTEFLNAMNAYRNLSSVEYQFGLSLVTSGTAHYIVAATVLIPASFGLASGIAGSRAVYVLYIVMDLIVFVAAVALLAWHCVWAVQLNILYADTAYVIPKRLTIALLALVSAVVGFSMLAAIFGFVGVCSRYQPKRGMPHTPSPPIYQTREHSLYKTTAWRDGHDDSDQAPSRPRSHAEVYQPWDYYVDYGRRPRY